MGAYILNDESIKIHYYKYPYLIIKFYFECRLWGLIYLGSDYYNVVRFLIKKTLSYLRQIVKNDFNDFLLLRNLDLDVSEEIL